MINIHIADSFCLSRTGLLSILSNRPGFTVVCQTLDSNQLLMNIYKHETDVVIMDINLQPICPFEVVHEICSNSISKFLILADEASDPKIIHLLRAGAQGCIQKDIGEESLLQAIRDVALNKSPISPDIAREILLILRDTKEPEYLVNIDDSSLSHREAMILLLISKGLPNKIIGSQLKITERTVEAHVRNILKKLNATNRTQAVFLASKNGWLPQPN